MTTNKWQNRSAETVLHLKINTNPVVSADAINHIIKNGPNINNYTFYEQKELNEYCKGIELLIESSKNGNSEEFKKAFQHKHY